MPTAHYWELKDGDFMVEIDDGVFTGVMTTDEIQRLKRKMPDLKWELRSETSAPKIGWMVREYLGTEVYRPPAGLTAEQVMDRSQWPPDFKMEPIRDEKLRVGDLLLCPGLGQGMFVGTVQGTRQGEPYFRSIGGSLVGPLEWGIDDRQCWTCSGLGNVEAIQKLEIG
jgi:hypothetical protein